MSRVPGSRWSVALGAALLGAAPLGGGCEPTGCEEDIRAQVIDQRIRLELGDEVLEAELADEPHERERGWMHRRCDREALLLVPERPSALPIWGCALVEPLDLHLIRDGVVVEVVRDLEPCSRPCGRCPVVGESIAVDAVLETPAGGLKAEAGTRVLGLP